MDVRELLEKAAKAAGLEISSYHTSDRFLRAFVMVINDDHRSHRFWNPLEDDGDALRLLHALKLDIHRGEDELGEPIITVVGDMPFNECPTCDEYDIAGFRRAIVRAAAMTEEK